MLTCNGQYEWCEGEPFVYKDGEGKEYCVFHAPKEKKGEGVTPEKFNEKVFKKINDVIRENKLPGSKGNKICNLSGTVFEGDIDFSRYNKDNPFPGINFSHATFSGKAKFLNATFSGEANFSDATFKGKGVADFRRVTFNEKADFENVRFEPELKVLFSEELEINKLGHKKLAELYRTVAKFAKEANFRGAIFGGPAEFNGVKFDGGAYFRSAKFTKKGKFIVADFREEADFRGTIFSEYAYFTGARFHEMAWFIGEDGKYYSMEEGEKDTSNTAMFAAGADFRNLYIGEGVRFKCTDLSNVTFINSDLRKMNFIGHDWPRKTYGIKFSRGEVLHDENFIFGPKGKRDSKEIEKVEILYRRLKQKYTNEHDWPEVSNWHYGEKEMARKAKWQRRFVSILFLYWLFGGYGERPVRAGVGLVVFILAISVLTGFTCFEPSPENYVYEGIIEKPLAYLINTLQYVTFQKETIFTPVSLWAHGVALFARVVIPLQAALFVLAVRNRFRR